jgi:hypothetical protein
MKLANRVSSHSGLAACLPAVLITCLVMPSVGSAETLASPELQSDTRSQLFAFDRAIEAPGCKKRKVLSMEVVEPPVNLRMDRGRMVSGFWRERWTLDRCGQVVAYSVDYEADGKGGTFFRFKVAK